MTIGNNLKRGFYKFALVLLIMLTGYVLFFSIFNWTDSVVIYSAASYGARLFMLIPAGLSLILLIYVKKLLGKVPENVLIYIIIGLSVIMVGLQIIMIPAMEVSFRYDALKVVDEAVSIFMDGGISGDTFDGYFSRYTNNYGITIFTFLVLKVLRVIGLLKADFSNAFPSLQAVNLVMMDFSILFACLFVKENKGSRAAVLTLLIAVINPMTYVWALFYYTNTVSMAFMMFVLYAVNHLCMQNGENEKKWKNYLLCFLIGLFTFIGYQIRATMIITVAAILLFLLVHRNRKIADKGETLEKLKRKRIGICCAAICFGILFGIIFGKALEQKYVTFEDTDTKFPAIHWIMMSSVGTGEYNTRDELYTRSFATAAEKKQADLTRYQERIKEEGILGYLQVMMTKLRITWADGTGDYPAELSISNSFSKSFENVLGDHSDFLRIYCQSSYILVLLLILWYSIRKSVYKNHDITWEDVIFLNLLGAMLFHMIWEAGNIYSIGFYALFLVAAGIEITDMKFKAGPVFLKRHKRGYLYAASGVCLVVVLTAVMGTLALWKIEDIKDNYCVNQYQFACNEAITMGEGEVYTQTFSTKKNFNHVEIQLRNELGVVNQSVYQVDLINDAGTVIDTDYIYAAKAKDYEFYPLSLNTGQETDFTKESEYTLKITKLEDGADYSLTFLRYDTGHLDVYPKGQLTMNNSEDEKRDLTFKVYYQLCNDVPQ